MCRPSSIEPSQFFDGFERSAFDNPETEEVESVEDFANRKKGLMESLRGKPGAEKKELAERFQNYVKKVEALRDQTVYVKVLEEGVFYVAGLAKSFETFFTSLEGNLKRLRTTIDLQRTKYDDLTGSTTRYVLATSECLDSLYRSMPYTGGVVTIDSDLSEASTTRSASTTCSPMRRTATTSRTSTRTRSSRYFADQVMEGYGTQIKVDVIEALEREYHTLKRNFEQANVVHYVTGEIDKAKRLAAPFLEQPLGEERHPIEACAYNPATRGRFGSQAQEPDRRAAGQLRRRTG